MTGRNRSTIYRDIKNGKLSATRSEKGGWEIDPAELERVYPRNAADNAPRNKSEDVSPSVFDESIPTFHRASVALPQCLNSAYALCKLLTSLREIVLLY